MNDPDVTGGNFCKSQDKRYCESQLSAAMDRYLNFTQASAASPTYGVKSESECCERSVE